MTVEYDLDDTSLGDFNLKFNVAQLLAYDQEPGEIEKILIAAIADEPHEARRVPVRLLVRESSLRK